MYAGLHVAVADRVHVDDDALEPDVAVEAQRELDQLGVDPGARVADRLDVELPELAEPTGLRPVIAEHRPGHRQLHGLRERLEAVLDVRPDDAGGGLRPERPGLALLGPRREAEQLLLDRVGDLAEAALEHAGLLEHRRLDLAVAVVPGEVRGDRLEAAQRRALGRQEVTGAARGTEGRHRRKSSLGEPATSASMIHNSLTEVRGGAPRRHRPGFRTMRRMSTGRLYRSIAGYLSGVALGSACLTLVFLGMRSVMEIGGACAEGGPFIPVQPCPDGAPIALIGGIFGLFGAAGLMIWFGSRLGGGYVSLVFLGWPALFISLGFNFLQFGLNPPAGFLASETGSVEWGFVVPGVLFWIMGIVPLVIGIAGWRAARSGRTTSASTTVNRLQRSVTLPPDRVEFAPNSFGARATDACRGVHADADRAAHDVYDDDARRSGRRRGRSAGRQARAPCPAPRRRLPQRRGVRRREGADPGQPAARRMTDQTRRVLAVLIVVAIGVGILLGVAAWDAIS